MKTKKSKTERLILLIKEKFNYDIENVTRTYAGRNMKASGAHTWTSNVVGSDFEIGSQYPIGDILEAKTIKIVEGFVFGQKDIEIID